MGTATANRQLDKESSAGKDDFLVSALIAQRNEITEHHVYRRLSRGIKDAKNRDTLKSISDDELKHYAFWKKITGQNVPPDNFKIWFHFIIAKIFGLTFAMKLMENGEGQAQVAYGQLPKDTPNLKEMIQDEGRHEGYLVDLVNEEHLSYVGSIFKGLNAAVVELVAALAGLTLVFHDAHLIALAGLVVGIAMTLSLVGGDYLGSKTDTLFKKKRVSNNIRKYLKGPVYAGSTALLVAFLLIMPFLTLTNRYVALGITVVFALTAIFLFNFYVSVTREVSFKAKLKEMAAISLGTATIAFLGAQLVRLFLAGLDQIR